MLLGYDSWRTKSLHEMKHLLINSFEHPPVTEIIQEQCLSKFKSSSPDVGLQERSRWLETQRTFRENGADLLVDKTTHRNQWLVSRIL